MKRVVVIGCNSFSGADFVDVLLETRDYEILGVSRSEKPALFLAYKRRADLSRFSFHELDVNGQFPELVTLLGDFRPAYVVNFAAQGEVASSWLHPEQWFRTNAVAVAQLSSWLKDQPWLERYVQISTPEVYGSCEGRVREDTPLDPSTPYAASKAAGDLMLFTLVKQYGFPLVTIRSTNVYGPHQQLYRIIPRTIIYLKLGRTIELHGGGRAVKSYIHIRDISRGELAAMEKGRPGEIYHLSPDDGGISVRELVRTVCERMGRDFDRVTAETAERPGQDRAYVIDSTKARRELGWAPAVRFDEGLDGVIEWLEANWEEILEQPLEYIYRP